MTRVKSAVALLSGGLDSCVAAAIAKKEGYELHALTIDYGQRHKRELAAASEVSRALGASSHKIVEVGLQTIGASALTDHAIPVPKGRNEKEIGVGIPVTYVPARNIVFLSIAAAHAEATGSGAIYFGANSIDYSGYPDCRPGFIAAFEEALTLGTKSGTEGRGIRVLAPLLRMSKAEIVRKGATLGAPLHLTWSCYEGGSEACGTCDSCLLRRKGFREAGIEDPTRYPAATSLK